MRTRPLPVTVAAILLALFSLLNLLAPLLLVGGPPAFVIYLSVVLGVLGLVAVAGLWMLKRWSMWPPSLYRAKSPAELLLDVLRRQ